MCGSFRTVHLLRAIQRRGMGGTSLPPLLSKLELEDRIVPCYCLHGTVVRTLLGQ